MCEVCDWILQEWIGGVRASTANCRHRSGPIGCFYLMESYAFRGRKASTLLFPAGESRESVGQRGAVKEMKEVSI